MSQIIIQNKPKDYDDVFNTNTYKIDVYDTQKFQDTFEYHTHLFCMC